VTLAYVPRIGDVSTWLRSVCCGAPLLSVYDFPCDRHTVHCGTCHLIVGVVRGEDQWVMRGGEIPPEPEYSFAIDPNGVSPLVVVEKGKTYRFQVWR
jgi:hypothetical protein